MKCTAVQENSRASLHLQYRMSLRCWLMRKCFGTVPNTNAVQVMKEQLVSCSCRLGRIRRSCSRINPKRCQGNNFAHYSAIELFSEVTPTHNTYGIQNQQAIPLRRSLIPTESSPNALTTRWPLTKPFISSSDTASTKS